MEKINRRGGKQRVMLVDMIHTEREPRVFNSHKELCNYFGFKESWLSQRIRRGKLRYGGYEIKLMDD